MCLDSTINNGIINMYPLVIILMSINERVQSTIWDTFEKFKNKCLKTVGVSRTSSLKSIQDKSHFRLYMIRIINKLT